MSPHSKQLLPLYHIAIVPVLIVCETAKIYIHNSFRMGFKPFDYFYKRYVCCLSYRITVGTCGNTRECHTVAVVFEGKIESTAIT